MSRERLPTDDQLWAEPHVTYQAWAERLHTPLSTIASAMRARGWHRKRGTGGPIQAPCAGCGGSWPVRHLDAQRRCGGCRVVAPVSELERERRAYLERRAR